MSIQDHAPRLEGTDVPNQHILVRRAAPAPATSPVVAARALAVVRIALGLTFLWAFLDKTFGWNYATNAAQAWINGGSPTEGFLSHVQVGPFQGTLRGWAGTGWADWLFMIALLGIGLALALGIGMRVAATAGTVLLALMWVAEWPPARHTSSGAPTSSTNPLVDYHLIYLVALIAVAVGSAGAVWGFGRWWNARPVVRRNPWLR